MSTLGNIIDRVNETLKEPFDWSEVDKAMIELHAMLSEPRWAIEDEKLREEAERLFVSYAVNRYINEV